MEELQRRRTRKTLDRWWRRRILDGLINDLGSRLG
jgi:hypothetical protein